MAGIHIKDPIVGRMAGLKFDPYEAIKPRTPVKVHVNLPDKEEVEKFAEEIRKNTPSPMRSAKRIVAQVVKELYTFALEKKVWTVYEVRIEKEERTDTRITWNTYYKFFTDKKQAKVWAERVGGVFMGHRLKRIANMTDSAFKAFLIANYSGGNDELITQWREAIKEKLKTKTIKKGQKTKGQHMKATKKPVTIECLKWTGVNFDEIKEFCGGVAEFHSCVESGCDELFIKTLEGTIKASAGDFIIKGVKGELYPCKTDIFEKTYDIEEKCEAIMEAPGTMHGFDWAIQMLKDGKKVQRNGWNGKGMFITLQAGSTVDGELMRNKPAKAYYTGKKCNICAHIDMKAADDTYVVGWLASQTDMLADDWQIAE